MRCSIFGRHSGNDDRQANETTSVMARDANTQQNATVPPELLRKGRFDEIYFVDVPSEQERQAIWRIQITKYGRDPKEFDLAQLSKVTEGLTGSEIEAVFVEAL